MKKFITGILIKTIIFSSLTYGVVHAAEWQIQNELRKQDVHCLALNIYYETKAVSLADAMAVSDVVLNRVNSRHYPNTACTVIKEGKQDANGNMIRHKCQFSWYCDGKSDIINNVGLPINDCHQFDILPDGELNIFDLVVLEDLIMNGDN